MITDLTGRWRQKKFSLRLCFHYGFLAFHWLNMHLKLPVCFLMHVWCPHNDIRIGKVYVAQTHLFASSLGNSTSCKCVLFEHNPTFSYDASLGLFVLCLLVFLPQCVDEGKWRCQYALLWRDIWLVSSIDSTILLHYHYSICLSIIYVYKLNDDTD